MDLIQKRDHSLNVIRNFETMKIWEIKREGEIVDKWFCCIAFCVTETLIRRVRLSFWKHVGPFLLLFIHQLSVPVYDLP